MILFKSLSSSLVLQQIKARYPKSSIQTMPSLVSKPSELLLVSSVILGLFHSLSTAAAEPLWTDCPTSSNYSYGSTYSTNLNLLLSSLSSKASTAPTGFANGRIGLVPDRVEGLAQCRGDTTGNKCRDCLDVARDDILNICSSRSAIVWYDSCLLRYSQTPIIPSSDNSPLFYLWNVQNISDPSRFSQLLGQLMNGLVSKAVSVPPDAPLYATDQTNFTSSQTLYGLVQCTGNLGRSDCKTCLEDAIAQIPACCDGKRGGRVIGPNCNFRFEVYKFYED